jgi:hypothetical protein
MFTDPSPTQTAAHYQFRCAVSVWNTFDSSTKEAWNSVCEAKSGSRNGYKYFISKFCSGELNMNALAGNIFDKFKIPMSQLFDPNVGDILLIENNDPNTFICPIRLFWGYFDPANITGAFKLMWRSNTQVSGYSTSFSYNLGKDDIISTPITSQLHLQGRDLLLNKYTQIGGAPSCEFFYLFLLYSVNSLSF